MMNHVVEATEIFGMNYAQTDCQFYDPGSNDPDCAGLCFAADE